MIAPPSTPGGAPWTPRAVVLSPRARRDFARLPAEPRERIGHALARFAAEGYGDVRKLTDVRPPVHRLRVGDFRVLFVLTPDRLEVERIANRREAY